MAKHKIQDIRNVALVGHGASGKTTLADLMLFKAGEATRAGSVDDGSSLLDTDDDEKEHKYTISSALCHFEHNGKRIHLIDTPGYPEFVGHAIGAIRAVETAVVVVNAGSGIEVNTRRTFARAGDAGVGRMVLINKLDQENINFGELLGTIQETFGAACVPLNVPVGNGHDFSGVVSTLKVPAEVPGDVQADPKELNQTVMDAIVEADEELMMRYLEGEELSLEEVSGGVAKAIAAGTLIPVFCASSKSDVGVSEFMNALASFGLNPTQIPRTATNEAGEEVPIDQTPDGPLVAQVFKTRIDPFVQKLSFVRVYSGVLKKDSTVHSPQARKGIKFGPLLEVQAGETHPIDEIGPGGIAAIAKCDEMHTGYSLGDVELPPLAFPMPMVGLAVAPKSRGDEAKLSGALHKVTEEDSTVHLDHDPETKEMVLTGMSELHLLLLKERIKRRDHVEIETHEPKIPYRETVQTNGDGSYRHKKQSGGAGQFGEVHIRMYPFPEGSDPDEYATKDRFPQLKSKHYHPASNFLWVDSVVGGSIPGN
ncbi:MAG: elongation factor G, partial [Planctomycetaceae bacterium]|nr:elongation factor G [Planctomycetaceae bacterium]